jgi:hypothetical protein
MNIYLESLLKNLPINKYTLYYTQIIEKSLHRTLSSKIYTEKHHILPKCLCQSKEQKSDKFNIAILTAREHYLCHKLLYKASVSTIYAKKMFYAYFMMAFMSVNDNRYKLSSREFEKIRTTHSLFNSIRMKERFKCKENHHMYGKHHSEETRNKISKALTGNTIPQETIDKMLATKLKNDSILKGERHHMYGKQHSEEYKQKMSESCKKIQKTEEWNKKNSESNMNRKHIANTITKQRRRLPKEEAIELVNSSNGVWIYLASMKPIPDYQFLDHSQEKLPLIDTFF